MILDMVKNDRPVLKMQLLGPDGAVVLTGATVKFLMGLFGQSAKIDTGATIDDAATGKVSYAFVGADLDTVDNYRAEWQVTFSGGAIETFPSGVLEIHVRDEVG